jgi:hypothetical protein
MPSHRGRSGICVVVLMAALPGCVERRYTIRTDPPGALVIANGEPLPGVTPVSKPFVFYGDRTFRIIKEGYQTVDVVQPIPAPWFDNLLTEFFTENVIPYRFRDEREFVYKLEPAVPDPSPDVLGRAEQARAEGQAPPIPRRKGILGFFGF